MADRLLIMSGRNFIRVVTEAKEGVTYAGNGWPEAMQGWARIKKAWPYMAKVCPQANYGKPKMEAGD